MRTTRFEDRVALLANVAQSLKPQGRVGVIDFRVEAGGPGPDLDERVDPDVVVADASRAGLRMVASETFLPLSVFFDICEVGGFGVLRSWGLGVLRSWEVSAAARRRVRRYCLIRALR